MILNSPPRGVANLLICSFTGRVSTASCCAAISRALRDVSPSSGMEAPSAKVSVACVVPAGIRGKADKPANSAGAESNTLSQKYPTKKTDANDAATANADIQRNTRRGRAPCRMRACMSCSGRAASTSLKRRNSCSRKPTSVNRR